MKTLNLDLAIEKNDQGNFSEEEVQKMIDRVIELCEHLDLSVVVFHDGEDDEDAN